MQNNNPVNPRRRRTKPPPPEGKLERGRPPAANKINLVQLQKLASIGMPLKSIAEYFGIHPETLSRYIKELPEANIAYRKGDSVGYRKALNSLCKAMENGNVMAIIFYLVNRHSDEWQSVNKGFQITNNNQNNNGQFGQMIAKDVEAGRIATDLVKRLSNKLPTDAD